MPIRFEYQPVGAGGLAAYATGSGRARERALNRTLNIYRDEQAKKARREEQLQQQQWADQRQQRQEAFQYSQDVSRFRQQSMLQDKVTQQKSASEFAAEQYEGAKTQFDAMQKEIGGLTINPTDSKEVQDMKGRISKYLGYEQKALDAGTLTPDEFRKRAASGMGAILRDYDPEKHVVPPQDRPGAQYAKGGRLYQRARNPEEEDTLIGWAPDSMLSPEGIAERDALKKSSIDTVNGVSGQWVPGRYGMEFKPIATPKAEKSEIGPEKRMTLIMSLAEKMRTDPSQPLDLEAAAKEVDKLLQGMGGSEPTAGGSAAATPETGGVDPGLSRGAQPPASRPVTTPDGKPVTRVTPSQESLPAVEALRRRNIVIEAARAGDQSAAKALDERGIPWRK
jgi:hypothetical protein